MTEGVFPVTGMSAAEGYRQYRIQSPGIARSARPGQYVIIPFSFSGGKEGVGCPLSIFLVEEGGFTVLIREGGRLAEWFESCVEQGGVSVVGPYGSSYPEADPAAHPIFVSGGTGFTSLYLLSCRYGGQGTFILGGRTGEDVVPQASMLPENWDSQLTTLDGSTGIQGLVTQPLEALLKEPAQRPFQIYACGPNPMLKAVYDLASSYDVPCSVSIDFRVECLDGTCGSCAVRDRRSGAVLPACTQGPVMDAYLLDWSSLRGMGGEN